MKISVLMMMLAASAAAVSAQAPAKPATTPAKLATAAKAAVKSPAATTAKTAAAQAEKVPAGVQAITAPKATLYSVALRYQDEKVGDGAVAEPGKLVKCNFTLWTAGADGFKVDSSDDRRMPVLDKDHKPVTGDDGKPKLGDAQPTALVMGQGRPLAGWDQGLAGMKVHGKRRIFIPWQLGLGDREVAQRDPNHQAIPAKTDLILDVEVVDVTDAPKPPQHHPPMPGPGAGMPPAAGAPPMGVDGGVFHAAPATPTAAPAPAAPAPAAPAPSAPPAAAPAAATPALPQPK